MGEVQQRRIGRDNEGQRNRRKGHGESQEDVYGGFMVCPVHPGGQTFHD